MSHPLPLPLFDLPEATAPEATAPEATAPVAATPSAGRSGETANGSVRGSAVGTTATWGRRRQQKAARRPANPAFLPVDAEERFRWVDEVGPEQDDARILAAITTLRDMEADPADRDAAVATLWRACSRVLHGTFARIARTSPGTPRHLIAESLSDNFFTALAHFRGASVGEFIAHAAAWVQGTVRDRARQAKRDARHRLIGFEPGDVEEGSTRTIESTIRYAADTDFVHTLPAPPDQATPEEAMIESLLVGAIDACTGQVSATAVDALRHYFGVPPYRGQGEHNRAALAREHGVTAERIRQLAERVRAYLHEQLGVPLD